MAEIYALIAFSYLPPTEPYSSNSRVVGLFRDAEEAKAHLIELSDEIGRVVDVVSDEVDWDTWDGWTQYDTLDDGTLHIIWDETTGVRRDVRIASTLRSLDHGFDQLLMQGFECDDIIARPPHVAVLVLNEDDEPRCGWVVDRVQEPRRQE